jgi:hypothetical protein
MPTVELPLQHVASNAKYLIYLFSRISPTSLSCPSPTYLSRIAKHQAHAEPTNPLFNTLTVGTVPCRLLKMNTFSFLAFMIALAGVSAFGT